MPASPSITDPPPLPPRAPIDSITIRPGAARWRNVIDAARARPLTPAQRLFREQLGLPTDRPIILSGHQAGFWHPGIAAKWFALVSAARSFDAHAAWIVVDQDTNDAAVLRLPMIARDGGGLTSPAWRAAPVANTDEVPTGRRPAMMPRPPAADGLDPALPGVGSAVRSVTAAMAARSGERDLARQVSAAAADLLTPLTLPLEPQLIFASDLARTSLLAGLIDRMRADPRAVADSYNSAVAHHSDSGVAMLATTGGIAASRGVELPLWRIAPALGSPRQRVYTSMLDSTPRDQLFPRALLMTGVLRLGGCDFFIHGLGGAGDDGAAGYEAISDAWLADWLRGSFGESAPYAAVSATMRLPFSITPPTPAQAAHAVWRAHHARHDPGLLGERDAAARKRALVEQIAAKRRSGHHPHDEFARLQLLLRETRARHADQLRSLDSVGEDMKRALAAADLVNDRTWPFPLFEQRDLAALRDRIDEALTRE